MADWTLIPTEIWQEILPLACTDGGFTGNSLALTSKFFKTQSSRVRYRTLAFRSLDQLFRFVGSKLPADLQNVPRLGTEHIYFSAADEQVPVQLNSRTFVTPHDFRPYYSLGGDTAQDWTKHFRLAFQTLLRFTYTSMRTLCVLLPDFRISLDKIFVVPLFKLEELTWLSPHIGLDIMWRDVPLWRRQQHFPALKRIHLAGSDAFNVQQLAELLTIHLPLVTHLRLSILSLQPGFDEATTHELARSLSVSSPVAVAPATAHAQLPSLRHLIVYSSSLCYSSSPWSIISLTPLFGPSSTELQWPLLSSLIQSCEVEHPEIRIVMMKKSPLSKSHWATRLRYEWLDRIQDGVGCWVNNEDEDDAWSSKKN
ncbi:hypothetical protein C8Q70DRAFT_992155 [Cubamyces menziesii]|uniref:Uncharacterized protein n=1 Tax=Trametes cubensis TaxID=1111947 RepID=A0AAD7TWI8_9APHY|nr:hypothetical protein C8Q70DRAFT_992155 [Cubamyces menziesii]KAJ8487556.1 hypothetical protein ONZ51_g4103 [Trametes cubensis]